MSSTKEGMVILRTTSWLKSLTIFIVKIPWEKIIVVNSSPFGNEKAFVLVSWKVTLPVNTGKVAGAGLTETEKDWSGMSTISPAFIVVVGVMDDYKNISVR